MEDINIPTYAYKCNKCAEEFDVIKPVAEIEMIEVCEECGFPAERVIKFKGHMSPDNVDAYYNHGLGKVVRTKNDVRQELSRLKGETGRDLIEVGTEVLKKEKPKDINWMSEEAINHFKSVRNGNRKS